MEKQVILDVIFEPFMDENYMQYEKFPYDSSGFLGHETAILNVVTFWKHYQAKYMDQMAEANVLEDEYEEWREKEGQALHGEQEQAEQDRLKEEE